MSARDRRLRNVDRLAFGARLKEIRTSQGLTQVELERRIGAGPGRVGNWEKWGSLPSLETIRALARELKIPIDVLLPKEEAT